MQSSPVFSLSPSFNSYSSSRLADIAARVVEEFRAEADDDGGGYHSRTGNLFLTDFEESLRENGKDSHISDKLAAEVIDEEKYSYKNGADSTNGNEDEEDEEEFEFAVFSRNFISSPTPADELFYNGQIRPCFPLFNQDLLLEGVELEKEEVNLSDEKSCEKVRRPPVRLSLRKLFTEDREPPSSSCSSSEADELDGVKPGSYCVWNPKTAAAAAEESRCKKSNSTGSSKRWKFRDLLHRSRSDGKDSFVFLTHSESKNAKKREEKIHKIEKFSVAATHQIPKAATAEYVKNDDDRRRMSFLPYRRDLVGFFSNVNGLSRNLHPF